MPANTELSCGGNNEQGISNLEGKKLHHSLFLGQYSIFKFKNNTLPKNVRI
ncbi:MAG: hypothetical protein KJ666_09835 [Bacteroidetes bacterium]|nr:hypothetical protein [Bacteroidota bacterium]MBU2584795.1 hypothetical protein [Bacteroidota bacterium]